MNTGYRIYWMWILVSAVLFFAGADSMKNQSKNLGTWLFIFSSASFYYAVCADFFKKIDNIGDRQFRFTDEPSSVTHTHNHYYHDTRSNVVEGTEHIDMKPDGSTVTTRHVKKWN